MFKQSIIFLLFAITVFIYGCCKPELRYQFELNNNQKEAIPYTENQKISFITNSGYNFDLYVSLTNEFIIPTDFDRDCLYDEFETLCATIVSEQPELEISFKSTALAGWEHELTLYNLELTVNNKWFYPDCEMGRYTTADFTDTTINNRDFKNAMVFELCRNYTNNEDTAAIYFEKVVCTKENGIELITFTNNDYYELVK
jgi:hypothetical protein